MSGVTTEEAVHLLPAGEIFQQGRRPSTAVAVCGEPVTSEPDGEMDPRYCPECVRAAIRWYAQPVAGAGELTDVSGVARR